MGFICMQISIRVMVVSWGGDESAAGLNISSQRLYYLLLICSVTIAKILERVDEHRGRHFLRLLPYFIRLTKYTFENVSKLS